MKEVFKPIKYNFNSGVTVELTEAKISAHDTGGWNSYIKANNIDNFSFSDFYEDKISPGGLLFRIFGISLLIVFASELFLGGWSLGSWGITGVLVIINALIVIVFIFDALFELNFFQGVVRKNFSNHVYNVVVGNSSGNNIEFYSHLGEENKLKKLKQAIEELQKHSTKEVRSKIIAPVAESSNLDELKKLGDLFKEGILTKEEFDDKKKEILSRK